MEDVLLTPEQVAQQLQITKAYLYQLKNAGKITAYAIGKKCLRFKQSDVNTFIEKNKA